MDILVGADPELFVQDGSGAFVSGHDLFPGTKLHPFQVPNGAVQVDGMAGEFNINPARTADEFFTNIKSVYTTMSGMLKPGLHLVASPVATFEKKYFDGLPKTAKELGCDPDFNAWTGKENPRPVTDKPFRTASGHIHIGWTKDRDPNDPAHIDDCHAVVQQMDYYLGLPSLLYDPDNKRRELYGKAGAHRRKPYGVEYRTLSNRWLSSPELIKYTFGNVMLGMEKLQANKWAPGMFGNSAQVYIDGNSTYNVPSYLRSLGIATPPKLNAKDLTIHV